MNASEYTAKMNKFCKDHNLSKEDRTIFIYLVENSEVFKNFYYANQKMVDEYRKLFINSK